MAKKIINKYLIIYYAIFTFCSLIIFSVDSLLNINDYKSLIIEVYVVWFMIVPMILIIPKYVLNKILLKDFNNNTKKYVKKKTFDIIFIVDIIVLLIVRVIINLIN